MTGRRGGGTRDLTRGRRHRRPEPGLPVPPWMMIVVVVGVIGAIVAYALLGGEDIATGEPDTTPERAGKPADRPPPAASGATEAAPDDVRSGIVLPTPSEGVETLAGTIRQLVAGKLQPGEFDLIYSTGLYGYLEQPIGQRVTTRLFDMLRPGGQLLIASFLTGLPECGYMESFMDWQLIYRSRDETLGLAAALDETLVDDIRLLTGSDQSSNDRGSIVLLQVTKR